MAAKNWKVSFLIFALTRKMKNDPIKNLIHEAVPPVSLGKTGAFWARFREKAGRADLRGEEIKALIREGTPELRLKDRETFWADFRTCAAKDVVEKARASFWRYRGIAAGISAMAASLLFCLPLFRPMSAEAGGMPMPEIRTYAFYETGVVGSSVIADESTDAVLLWAICDEVASGDGMDDLDATEPETEEGIREIRAKVANHLTGDMR